jgi:hypothetical protein
MTASAFASSLALQTSTSKNTRILGVKNPQFSRSFLHLHNRGREYLLLLLTRTFPIKTHQERIGLYREHLPLVQTLQRTVHVS